MRRVDGQARDKVGRDRGDQRDARTQVAARRPAASNGSATAAPSRGRRAGPWLAVLPLLVALAALLVPQAGLAVTSPRSATGGQPRTVRVTANEYAYAPDRLVARPGEALAIELVNTGAEIHNIVFVLEDGREVSSPDLESGMSYTLELTAPTTPGTYVFYCSIGIHRELGMEGVLVVEPDTGPSPTPGAATTFVENLRAPRGLSLAGDRLLVAEGGRGDVDSGGRMPGDGDGRVLQLDVSDPVDRRTRLAGITNLVDPSGMVLGATHAIALAPAAPTSTLVVAAAGLTEERAPQARLVTVPQDGPPTVLADLLAHETTHNPDGGRVDSLPWALARGPDGDLYVSDHEANAVLRVDPVSGQVTTWAVLAPIGTWPGGTPIEARPTGLAVAPDGALHVVLSGSWLPQAGRVVRLADANGDGDARDPGEQTLLADGLTTPTDIALGPGGEWFALERDPGRVRVIGPPGRQAQVDGLPKASGMVFTPAGDLLVTAARSGSAGWTTDRLLRVPASALTVTDAPTATPGPPSTPSALPTRPTVTPQPTQPTATSTVTLTPTPSPTPAPTATPDPSTIALPYLANRAWLVGRRVELAVSDTAFTPDELHAVAGERLTIALRNTGLDPHGLAFDFGPAGVVRGPEVPAGGAAEWTVRLPAPGSYAFYDPIGFNRQAGLEGQLIVAPRMAGDRP